VIQRVFGSLVVGTVIVGLACVDMSAPKGPASISNLKLPSPSVIVGDTMRDSLGQKAALTIIAFNSAGDTIVAPGAQFFITDTTKAAHLNSGTTLVGDKIGSTVLVGQIGSLQTSAVTVPVTFKPAAMFKTSTDSVPPAFLPAPAGDSTKTGTTNLSLRVLSAQDSGSVGIVVSYTITHAPASARSQRPAVTIQDNASHVATADTTLGGGNSSRRLVVTAAFLGDQAFINGTKPDSAVVEAHASYKGVELANSPIRFVIPIKVVF
jgi:hypothetical protein